MKSGAKVFSMSCALLCRYHIIKNVRSRIKLVIRTWENGQTCCDIEKYNTKPGEEEDYLCFDQSD